MIDIGSPAEEMHPRFLEAPGGFAWWYVDLVTPAGDGLVLIWSYGLPFLPGYAAAARRGRAQLPRERPSVNLALYRQRSESFYILQEYDGDARSSAPLTNGGGRGHLRIGSSEFASWVENGRRRVEARLDCALPGTTERLTGTVRLDGVARGAAGRAADASAVPHLWTPLVGPARAEADLRVGERPLARLAGRAYHDRNGGTVPLHGLGIDHWMWGRLPFGDRERIYYLLWPVGAGEPRGIGVEVDERGEERIVDDLRVEVLARRRNYLGLAWAERLRLWEGSSLWLDVAHSRPLDNGPFYIRYRATATAADGERASAFGEICYPDEVDRTVHRHFVRMRVHDADGGNSAMLPFFAGQREGRARRLVRHLLVGARRG
jgi:carotenoid 1,2-hydratase